MTGPVCQQIKAEVSSLCDAPPGRYLIMYEIDIRAFGGSLSTCLSPPLLALSWSLPVFSSVVSLFLPRRPRQPTVAHTSLPPHTLSFRPSPLPLPVCCCCSYPFLFLSFRWTFRPVRSLDVCILVRWIKLEIVSTVVYCRFRAVSFVGLVVRPIYYFRGLKTWSEETTSFPSTSSHYPCYS